MRKAAFRSRHSSTRLSRASREASLNALRNVRSRLADPFERRVEVQIGSVDEAEVARRAHAGAGGSHRRARYRRAVSSRGMLPGDSQVQAGRHVEDNFSPRPGVQAGYRGNRPQERQMADQTGGDGVVDALEAAGVEVVFGIPSVHNLPVYDALRRRGPDPGRDRAPRAGRRRRGRRLCEGDGAPRRVHQLDRAGGRQRDGRPAGGLRLRLARSPPDGTDRDEVPRCRAGFHPRGARSALDVEVALEGGLALGVRRRDRHDRGVGASAGRCRLRRGPVSVELPIDLQYAAAAAGVRPARETHSPRPPMPPAPSRELAVAAELLAERPPTARLGRGRCRLLGCRSRSGGARTALGAGLITSPNGRGILAEDDALCIGNLPWEPAVRELCARADLLVGIGTRYQGPNTENWKMQLPATIVQIDVDPARPARSYPAAAAVTGDARQAVARSSGGSGRPARRRPSGAGTRRCAAPPPPPGRGCGPPSAPRRACSTSSPRFSTGHRRREGLDDPRLHLGQPPAPGAQDRGRPSCRTGSPSASDWRTQSVRPPARAGSRSSCLVGDGGIMLTRGRARHHRRGAAPGRGGCCSMTAATGSCVTSRSASSTAPLASTSAGPILPDWPTPSVSAPPRPPRRRSSASRCGLPSPPGNRLLVEVDLDAVGPHGTALHGDLPAARRRLSTERRQPAACRCEGLSRPAGSRGPP